MIDLNLENLETSKKLIIDTATFIHRDQRETYLKMVNHFLRLYD